MPRARKSRRKRRLLESEVDPALPPQVPNPALPPRVRIVVSADEVIRAHGRAEERIALAIGDFFQRMRAIMTRSSPPREP